MSGFSGWGPETTKVLREVGDERLRQDARWGQVQTCPNFTPLLTWGRDLRAIYRELLGAARSENDDGIASFESILREEYCEAMLEDDPVKLRAELVQVAAVAVKWVEHIDRRSA